MRLVHELIEDVRGWQDEKAAAALVCLVAAQASLAELADRFVASGLRSAMAFWPRIGATLPIHSLAVSNQTQRSWGTSDAA
jgi:hypothetical protein